MYALKSVLALLLFSAVTLTGIVAQDRYITLGWAAWDPANALVELSKDFTKETNRNAL